MFYDTNMPNFPSGFGGLAYDVVGELYNNRDCVGSKIKEVIRGLRKFRRYQVPQTSPYE